MIDNQVTSLRLLKVKNFEFDPRRPGRNLSRVSFVALVTLGPWEANTVESEEVILVCGRAHHCMRQRVHYCIVSVCVRGVVGFAIMQGTVHAIVWAKTFTTFHINGYLLVC